MRSALTASGFVRCVAAFAALLALFSATLPAQAAEARATLRIRINVAPYSRIQVTPPRFVVSERDIARGYVDVESPVVIAVLSNLREGYTLMFTPQGDQVQEAVVSGPGLALQVAQAGAQASRPAAGPGMWNETLQLRVRLLLAKTATPGEHPWPVAISMIS